MPNCCASSGLSSVFTFTSATAPPSAFTSPSMTGPSTRHGPHQGAQKSTTTGNVAERWSTSCAKSSDADVEDLQRRAHRGSTACG